LEDLVIHGTLVSHPQIGLLLPLATAMNAVSLFRLFSKMFLPTQKTGISGISDAIPRERWVLAAIPIFIVAAGVMPYAALALRRNAAQALNGSMAPHSATVASDR
jgi:NADH-quinone oxidoreductase subunit M